MKGSKLALLVIALLLIVAGGVYFTQGSGVSHLELRDFAVKDTAALERIFMADTYNRTIELVKGDDGKWRLDNKVLAQQHSVKLILNTLYRMRVKSPVPKTTHNTVIKGIIAQHTKVELYEKGENTPLKTYFVGNATPDHYGTYMLLETEEGRSQVPFIMEMPGFYGFLTSRFHCDFNQWRFSGIFNIKEKNIASLSMAFNEEPSKSFRIDNDGNNIKTLSALATGENVGLFDTIMLRNYLTAYEKIHYDRIESGIDSETKDSIVNSLPIYTINLTDQKGEQTDLQIFRKPNDVEMVDENNVPIPYDNERMYALLNNQEFVIVQNFVMDKLFVPIAAFQRQ